MQVPSRFLTGRLPAPLRRALWGLAIAGIVAIIYLAIAGAVWLLPGQTKAERAGVGFARVALLYLQVAAVAGPVIGVLVPIAKLRLGGIALGFIGGAVTGWAAGPVFLQPDEQAWVLRAAYSCLLGFVLGAPIGHMATADIRAEARKLERRQRS